MCPTPLDAPHRDLFISIFKSVVALSVLRQIIFLFACIGRPIQLYEPPIVSNRGKIVFSISEKCREIPPSPGPKSKDCLCPTNMFMHRREVTFASAACGWLPYVNDVNKCVAVIITHTQLHRPQKLEIWLMPILMPQDDSDMIIFGFASRNWL